MVLDIDGIEHHFYNLFNYTLTLGLGKLVIMKKATIMAKP